MIGGKRKLLSLRGVLFGVWCWRYGLGFSMWFVGRDCGEGRWVMVMLEGGRILGFVNERLGFRVGNGGI